MSCLAGCLALSWSAIWRRREAARRRRSRQLLLSQLRAHQSHKAKQQQAGTARATASRSSRGRAVKTRQGKQFLSLQRHRSCAGNGQRRFLNFLLLKQPLVKGIGDRTEQQAEQRPSLPPMGICFPQLSLALQMSPFLLFLAVLFLGSMPALGQQPMPSSNHSSVLMRLQVHEDCSDAPTDTIRRTCLKLRQIDRKARQAIIRRVDDSIYPPSVPGSPVWLRPIPASPNSRGQVAWNPYDCMTLQCLCPFFRGQMRGDGYCHLPSGEPLAMAYRKEYRMMTDEERDRFHRAFNQLKFSGEYDNFALQHRSVSEAGAHSGPGFLPWHREFVKRMEIALRLIDPTVAIPYWDSVLDNYLPDPRDSIFFSPLFAGEVDWNGLVVNGPFAFWRTLEGRNTIWRTLSGEGGLFTEGQLAAVANEQNIEHVLAYTVPLPGCPIPINYQALEYSHSNIHFWVGGDLRTPEFSANDPVFYMHHSFVDLVFEIWRQRQQPRWVREWAYTSDLWSCGNEFHFSYAWMRPFDFLSNRDGLSNAYTDQLYRYAQRPVCSARQPTCGSRYLFCDFNHGWPHCVAKIKFGGMCGGFEGMDACFNGQCIFGRCQQGPTPPPWRPPPPPTPPTPIQLRPMMNNRPRQPPRRQPFGPLSRRFGGRGRVRQFAAAIHKPFVDCFNRNPCCETWAEQKDECKKNSPYMEKYCRAACGICTPNFNSSDECKDRHVSCKQWKELGECGGRSRLFLEENCRESCGLCDQKKFEGSCLTQMHSAMEKEQRELKKLDNSSSSSSSSSSDKLTPPPFRQK